MHQPHYSDYEAADRREYEPFGQLTVATCCTPTPFGFGGQAGYQSDADTGLMLLGHRYYDASIGRFISRDPVQDGDNWYTYCDNDPVSGVDSDGLKPTHREKAHQTWLGGWTSGGAAIGKAIGGKLGPVGGWIGGVIGGAAGRVSGEITWGAIEDRSSHNREYNAIHKNDSPNQERDVMYAAGSRENGEG